MSEASKQMIAVEDRMAGRTVPSWKITLTVVIVGFAIAFARGLPDDLWISYVIAIVAGVSISILLGPYRKRSVR